MRTQAIAAVMLTSLLLAVVPTASAQGWDSGFQSVSGDPAYHADAAECLEQVGWAAEAIQDGVTCAVLYGHIFDLLNKVPINIQRPPAAQPDLGRGITSQPIAEELAYDKNQLLLYSSPGFVEYKSPSDTKPRLHPERGITDDVKLAKDIPIIGYWYMSADATETPRAGGDNVPGDVGALPCLTVRMVLQTGRDYGGGGDVLAEGMTTKTIITDGQTATQEGTGQTVDCTALGGKSGEIMNPSKVTEFRVDLGTAAADIPATQAFLVWVEWFQWSPSDPDDRNKAGQKQWNVHTGPDYPNRVVVPLENPVRIEKVRPQPFNEKIYIHGVYNSPWGSYDVDPSTMKVTIYDADGKMVENPTIATPSLTYSVDHDGHFKPVNATFEWDYKKDGLAPGEYRVELSVLNWQNTGKATNSGKIVIGSNSNDVQGFDDQNQLQDPLGSGVQKVEEGPVASPLLVLSLVGAALAAMTRIRRR